MGTDPYPLVSVIVITYNREKFLLTSLQSILDQNYPHLELIIVDDGSTDNTFSLIEKLNDPRIKYFLVEHCGKIGWLRKFGMEKAAGAYIAFNDSDDRWLKGKLQAQVKALQTHPEVRFCLVNGYNTDGNHQMNLFYPDTQGYWKGPVFHACFSPQLVCFTQTLLFYKDCLQANLVIPDEKISDRNFIVSLAHHFQGIILYEPYVERLIHQDGITLSKWHNSYLYEIQLIKYYKQNLPKNIYRKALFSTHINFGEACLKRGKKWEAAMEFIKASWITPLQAISYKKLAKALVH